MYPTYDELTGLIVIEWYERKKKKAIPVRHYFEQKPIKLQLHPADHSRIVRVHFSGKMPGWIKDYCEIDPHKFKIEVIRFGEEQGWMLVNWTDQIVDSTPIASPNLNGAIKKLAYMIPSVCPELEEQLLEHEEIAVRNLRNYNDIFNNIGVYYRPEEINGSEGCLALKNSLILIKTNEESEQEFRKRLEGDGGLFTMVRELTNPLPEPTLNSQDPSSSIVNQENNEVNTSTLSDQKELHESQEEEDELLSDLEEEGDELLGDLEEEGDELLGDLEEKGDELLGDLEEKGDELLGDLEEEGDELLGDLEEEGDELLGDLEEEGDELLGDLEEERDELLGNLEDEEELHGGLEEEDESQDDSKNEIETKNQDELPCSEDKGSRNGQVTNSVTQMSNVSEEQESHQFIILEYNDKRAGVLGGQMSIF